VLFPQAHLKHRRNCRRLVTLYAKAVTGDAAAMREPKQTKVGEVTLIGNRATVGVLQPHQGQRDPPLVKTADGWHISKLIVRVAAPRNSIEG
jgi:hypothetical protein